jgi:hypothetical protein
MLLSAIGLALSGYAHVMALLGTQPAWGESVWFLHIGIFVVWLPVVLFSQRVMRGVPQKDFWKVVLSGCPEWMKVLQKVVLIYAVANFLYFMLMSGSSKSTEAFDPSVIRGFSGHWLIFYGAAFSTFYSLHRRPDLLNGRECPMGHAMSHDAEYCSTCGAHAPVRGTSA